MPYKYEIGAKFNFLTLLKRIPDTRRGEFICDCGNKLIADTCNVFSGHTKSCGCYNSKLASDRWKQRHADGKFKSKPKPSKLLIYDFWNTIVKQAKRRNYTFTITAKYAEEIFLQQNKKCALSGLNLTLPTSCIERRQCLHNASLDRIDNNLGYIEGNVRWVHKRINMMKHSMSDSDFIVICNLVSNIHHTDIVIIDDSFKMNKGGMSKTIL